MADTIRKEFTLHLMLRLHNSLQSNVKLPTKKANAAEPDWIVLSVWVHPSLQLPFDLDPSSHSHDMMKLTHPVDVEPSMLIDDLLWHFEDVLNNETRYARSRRGGLELDIQLNVLWNVKDNSAALNPSSTVGDHFESGDTFGVHGMIVESEVGGYKAVAAGSRSTVLLRDDGRAAACGKCTVKERCEVVIPELMEGFSYTQVAVHFHAVLLQSDGTAKADDVPARERSNGKRDIPALAEGVRYEQVSAGSEHTVLLRSDGAATACGDNSSGQCDLPALADGVRYTQVSAGGSHTVLLRSDFGAMACGDNRDGQCDLPALRDGMRYTQVSAGIFHTVLLRNDGAAVACGWKGPCRFRHFDPCDIPELAEGVR